MVRTTVRVLAALLAILPLSAGAAEYSVGPGRQFAAIAEVPWESLAPGDRVLIHWREQPYREKWVICRRGEPDRPIRISGVPDPQGRLPVIDGREAATPAALNYWGEERGVLKIGGANRPADTLPAHLIVENLEIRSGRPPAFFTGRHGRTAYAKNAASIFVEKGEHITLRNCVLHDSGNGLFVSPLSSQILVEHCSIYDNGIEGSIYEHNSYTSADGIVFQFNHYGPLRQDCPGNNLKDRSAGLVVRYNWIEGGNRQLDLVDAGGRLGSLPSYRRAYAYGNVLVEREGDGNSQIVHYGGDSEKTDSYRKGVLFFYHNTVVSSRAGTTTLFRLSTSDETVDCRNNIVYVTAPGRQLALLAEHGTVRLARNWFKTGWRDSHGEMAGAIEGRSQVIDGNEPGFRALAEQDYHLSAGSSCLAAGSPLAPEVLPEHAVRQRYVRHRQAEPRELKTPPDLGAF